MQLGCFLADPLGKSRSTQPTLIDHNCIDGLNAELRSLIATQDQERRWIASNLHDSLGQELVAAKMAIEGILLRDQAIDSVSQVAASEASGMIDRAIQQVEASLICSTPYCWMKLACSLPSVASRRAHKMQRHRDFS